MRVTVDVNCETFEVVCPPNMTTNKVWLRFNPGCGIWMTKGLALDLAMQINQTIQADEQKDVV